MTILVSLTRCVKFWFVFVCLLHCVSRFDLCSCVSYIMCQGLFYIISSHSRGLFHLISSVGLIACVSYTVCQGLICVRVWSYTVCHLLTLNVK